MTRLSCTGCGQRYYGTPSQSLTCDFCHAPVVETGWTTPGRRHASLPLPAVQPPLPAYLESAPEGSFDPYERRNIGASP